MTERPTDLSEFSDPFGLPGHGFELAARQQLARIPITRPPGLFGRITGWLSRRMLGQEPDNGWALAANPKVLWAVLGFERKVAGFDALDPGLKALAVMAVAQQIGCSWCVDFGYFMAARDDLDLARLREVSRWQESEMLTDLERAVVAYAVAATATPSAVTDEMVVPLRAELGDRGLVELTMMIAVENQRSRFNASLGLVSQGFSAVCQLPSRP